MVLGLYPARGVTPSSSASAAAHLIAKLIRVSLIDRLRSEEEVVAVQLCHFCQVYQG